MLTSNSRRRAALLLCLALVAGACGPGGGSAPRTASRPQGEREAGRWKTWVLSFPSEVAVPPPPRAGSAAARADLRELKQMAGQRTVEVKQQIEKWNTDPALKPWVDLNLELVAARPKDPVNASRGYGYTSAAIYDAVVAAWRYKYLYNRPAPTAVKAAVARGPDPSYPSEHAAIAGAASRVLAYLFPERPAVLYDTMAEEAADSRVAAGVNYPSDVEAGLALGRAVADKVIARAKADGSDRPWDGKRPHGRGFWEPPPGSTALPVQPLAGTWKTWVMSSGSQFRAPPPPEFGSQKYIEECMQLIHMQQNLTEDQKRMATFWAGGQGTSLPPGVWNEVMLAYVKEHRLSIPESARTFALLNVAQADAGIAAWDTKYTYWTPRPENAIRDLGLAPGWKPFIQTPFFPAYVSGHSTYSGAAQVVMSYLFPEDDKLFRQKAEEAGMSRLYGGIHFPSDNVEGLKMGRKIGELVVNWAKDGNSS